MMLFNLHVVVTNSTECFIREYYQIYIELFMVLDTLTLLVENFTIMSSISPTPVQSFRAKSVKLIKLLTMEWEYF